MKYLFKRIVWGVISILISILCVYIIKPETIISQEIVESIEDLSLAHGEGYVQEGNRFINQEENAFFVYDLGEGIEKYEAIDLFLDVSGEMEQQNISVDLYHSSEGSEIDKVLVSGELPAGEKEIQFVDDFSADRFIRIYVHAPVGQAYTISAIAVERQTFNLNILSAILIFFIATVIYFIGRKVGIVEQICRLVKWLWNKYDAILERIFSACKNHMMKCSPKRIKQEQYMLLLGSQIILLFFMIWSDKLLYATNDDTTMVAIAGGGYVTPSEYIVNMHIVAGWLLKGLFTALPGINWVTIFYLFGYLVSFVLLDKIVIEKIAGSPLQFFGKAIILDICFGILMGHFSFTIVAYTAAIAGTTAFIYSFEIRKKSVSLYSVFGILLIILASLVRAETLKTVIAVILLICIYDIVQNRNIRYLVLEILIVGIMVLSIKSNFMLMNGNPVEEEFLNWGELRSEALDCAAVPYVEESFEKSGISWEEYSACYNAFYYIKDAVSEEKMQKLIELNQTENKYNFDVMGFVKEHFSYITDIGSYKILCKWIFVCLFLLNMFLGIKRTREKTLLVWLGTVGVEFVYYFIQRSLYRVVMPAYILGSVLLILFSDYDRSKLEAIWKNRINYKKMYIFGCMIFAVVCAAVCIKGEEYERAAYSDERKKVLDYMEENEDKLFLAGDPAVFSIGICDSVWDYAGKDGNWNLIGNWEIYSVPSNHLMKAYGYSDYNNIAKEAVNNDNMLFLTTYALGFEERAGYILDLYERYYGIRPEFEKVEDICNNQISETARENWAVYRLVY